MGELACTAVWPSFGPSTEVAIRDSGVSPQFMLTTLGVATLVSGDVSYKIEFCCHALKPGSLTVCSKIMYGKGRGKKRLG